MPSSITESVALAATAAPGVLNVAWADRFVAALHAAGVRHVVLCSGSRSAPLALAFDRSPITTHVSLDERSAGFFALGLAKASRRPVAVVCTSGTAAANLLPAIVEARHARVPLVIATADRPPEMRDTGAAQTIDQIKLFGGAVRWFVEVGTPDGSPSMLEYVASLGARAASESGRAPAGPVHLNFAFREPLVPEPGALPALPKPPAWSGTIPDPPSPGRGAIERLAKAIRSRRRGLIVCGPDDAAPSFADSVTRLAEMTGYPVLADPASQVRFGALEDSPILGAYDSFLRSPVFAASHGPEIVIQFGAALTSKAFHLYEALHPGALHVPVDPAGEWRSPLRRAREVVAADSAEVVTALCDALARGPEPDASWARAFRSAEMKSREIIALHVARSRSFAEGRVFPEILRALPDGATLYVGNSMAIRDLDAFAPWHARRVRVLANRGANGIDGLLSSALGASAASASPLLLVTGDLAFHHDLTALHMARDGAARATIVVVNNDGGGIFSFLPVARHPGFERYFGTPHGLDFAPAVSMYGIPYSRPGSWDDLRAGVRTSLENRACEVFEVRTQREENRAFHQAMWDEIARTVAEDDA